MPRLQYPLTIRELAYREAEATYAVDLHTHTGYQFYCVLRGDVAMQVGDVVHKLGPGQCIIVPPGVQRRPYCVGRAPHYLVAMIDVHEFSMDQLCDGALHLTEAMSAQIDLLVIDLQEPDFGNALDYRHAIFCQLFIDIRRRLSTGRRTQQLPRLNMSARDEVVAQAEAFMQANLHMPLNREHIAQAVHFSAPHLARLFKASLDMTINQRLTQLRLDQAKRLLLQSTYSITMIAGEVGFQSFSHFAKLFHAAVNMTPSDYRSGGGRRLSGR